MVVIRTKHGRMFDRWNEVHHAPPAHPLEWTQQDSLLDHSFCQLTSPIWKWPSDSDHERLIRLHGYQVCSQEQCRAVYQRWQGSFATAMFFVAVPATIVIIPICASMDNKEEGPARRASVPPADDQRCGNVVEQTAAAAPVVALMEDVTLTFSELDLLIIVRLSQQCPVWVAQPALELVFFVKLNSLFVFFRKQITES